jgi:putative ABC transport system ATP-binding protein
MEDFIIRLKNINKSYGIGKNPLHVLKGIDLDIKKGELVSIMGSSGSGKSTLLNVIGILDSLDEGEYILDGLTIKDLTEKKSAQLRNEMIGFVFQSFNLISFKNAMENVALPLYYKGISRKKRNKIAMEMLDKMGLTEWWHHLPNELSGGQKQRIAIARALVSNPRIILADEPTGALDSKTSMEMMDLLKEINQTGITILIVTHEYDIAHSTDRIIHLKDGLIERTEVNGKNKHHYFQPAS